MSTVVDTNPAVRPGAHPAERGHANLGLRCVLDAEIEALKTRLQKKSADAAVARGPARADQDRQVAWLRFSLAKLQARRDALG